MECSICGANELVRPIYRALSSTGIILVCENCAKEQGYPLVKSPGIKKEDIEKKDTVYETMVRLSGVKGKEQQERFHPSGREGRVKEIISKGYEKKTQGAISLAPRPDLVENFHWIIMRVRRVKGLTQAQLAERIGETESAVKMAEQGVIPQGYDLPERLERFLGVKLIKDKTVPPVSGLPRTDVMISQSSMQTRQPARLEPMEKTMPQPLTKQQTLEPEIKGQEPKISYPKSGVLNFDRKLMDNLKIDDLKKMKMGKESSYPEEESSNEKRYAQDYD